MPEIRVLIVDDEEDMRALVRATIELAGPDVAIDEAVSGADAIARLEADRPEVVVLDHRMPGFSGLETAKRIRTQEKARQGTRHTPIIFISAYDMPQFSPEQAYTLGAVDYLIKPVVPSILKSKVAVFVQLKRQAELLEAKNIELNAIIEELESFFRALYGPVPFRLERRGEPRERFRVAVKTERPLDVGDVQEP